VAAIHLVQILFGRFQEDRFREKKVKLEPRKWKRQKQVDADDAKATL